MLSFSKERVCFAMRKKAAVILNPQSGMKQGKRNLADIVGIFCTAQYDVNVYVTSCRGDATVAASRLGKECDLVVCIGGDGTFNEVVSGMVASGNTAEIGYIPAGSTNDFANSLGLSKNMLEAAKQIVDGTPQKYDVGKFNDRYFTYVASFGAFTRASYNTPQKVKNALGHVAYVLEGVKELGNIQPINVEIDIDGETLNGEYIFGAVCNSTSLGGILTLSPDVVDMNDGLFEMLLVKAPKNILDLNECIAALTSQNYQSRMLVFKSGKNVTVKTEKTLDWSLDGEHANGGTIAAISNLHDAVKLVSKE